VKDEPGPQALGHVVSTMHSIKSHSIGLIESLRSVRRHEMRGKVFRCGSRLLVRTNGLHCSYMPKTLTRTGNSLALVLDKPILEATGIDADTPLEVSTDGDVILISPVRSRKRTAKLKKIMEELDREHAGAFKRLAE